MIRNEERFFSAMEEICDSADMIEDAVGQIEAFGEMSDSSHDLILQKCIAIRALVRYAEDRHIDCRSVAPDEEAEKSDEERETDKEVSE